MINCAEERFTDDEDLPIGTLPVRVDPAEMIQYVHSLMATPRGDPSADASSRLAQRQWGGDTVLARAAHLRWSALNRAFGDRRVSTWTTPKRRDHSCARGIDCSGRCGPAQDVRR